jgi:single-stranded DNA-specific DHH superfamily exonuclease
MYIDTKIYEHERDDNILEKIDRLAPFGEWNEEPIFLLEDIIIKTIEKIGSKWKWHLKIHGMLGDKKIVSMFRWKGDEAEEFITHYTQPVNLIWKIRKDTFNGGFYLEWVDIQ